MPDEPQSFSHGIDNLLLYLRPYVDVGKSAFPPKLTREVAWLKDNEHILEWFVRCVDQPMDGNPERWRIEEDIACFAYVEWSKGQRLKYANIQMFRTLMPLDEFYCRAVDAERLDELLQQCTYLRFDYDRNTVAPMFSHPLPHIHARPKGAPRFGLPSKTSNAVMDFLEFVYGQFYHHAWTSWARRVWIGHPSNQGSESAGIEFQRIFDAFDNQDIETLRTETALINRMVRVWSEAKFKLFNAESDVELQRSTSYPQ